MDHLLLDALPLVCSLLVLKQDSPTPPGLVPNMVPLKGRKGFEVRDEGKRTSVRTLVLISTEEWGKFCNSTAFFIIGSGD